ncbi:MAG: hypothetical protein HYY58_04275 [Candidatus Omnitrophica bacterium]|nr:hypothetical protein [Candidatus Omnitrophota bacterium]
MKVFINPERSKRVITTIAIGDDYYNPWKKYAFPTWKKYCERYGLGLIVFDADLIPKDSKIWKKPTWQKLLIGNALKRTLPAVTEVCYLDSDTLINYTAPNVFDVYIPGTIGLVSSLKNLPYSLEEVLRRIAFFRHNCYDQRYPLDSALFISVERYYQFHGLAPQADIACMGMFLFNVSDHAELMGDWFSKYDRQVQSMSGGGEGAHLNYEMQSWGNICWLDYKFQAIWTYEMAWKYPFLYDFGRRKKALIRECIEASLFTNYFLHFAGSWYENDMWQVGGVLVDLRQRKKFEDFSEYVRRPVSGEPVGIIKPKKTDRLLRRRRPN